MVTTAHDHQIAAILHEAELSPPQRIPTLAESHIHDFEFSSSLSSNIDEARSFLVQQRISEPGYRPPEQQKRHIFRSKKSKDEKCNRDNWIFTKREVAKAFNDLLSHTPLPTPGIAQALLSHAPRVSLEELWCHFYDPNLEKRTESLHKKPNSSALPKTVSSVALKARSSVALRAKSSVALRTKSYVALETASIVVPKITWLDEVCGQENLEYIRLMCQAGLGQDTLDRAFRVALSKHSMDAMEVLLSFGAVVSAACENAIRERVKLHDVALVGLLLSAPNAMSVEAWRGCIEPEVQSLEAKWIRPPDLLLLCLAHRPDVVCSRLLLKALESHNLPATTIILAYGRFFGEYFRDVRQLACENASCVQDDEHRHKFFSVLVKSEFVVDSAVLRQELMKDVKTRQLPLIKLLADAGVVLDIEPHNAFSWAVSHMEFDILELFKSGKFSSPISLALKSVPDSTSESDMLRLVGIFGSKGLAGEPLDSHLIRAVRRRHIRLVDTLIRRGASVEFEQASAIQTALEDADLDILSILLRSKCSVKILSATIPTAMVLKPRPIRLQAMKALVKKEVLPQALGVALQRLVSEDGDADSELIQLLLQHGAPVDGVGDDANNVVLVAARRGNLSILRMLCDAGPRNETLSKAIPVAFGVIDSCGYDVALDMIKLLLQKGAAGLPTHQTLLAAAKQDSRLNIVRLLVKHGADANYASGASFGVALKTSNFKLLQILCALCPPNRASMESGFFMAIDPRYYNPEALELLLSSTRYASTALNTLWSSEKLRGNPNIIAIVPHLLQHGLDVNLRNGVLLSFAIQEKNVILLKKILSANPSITSLTAAFHTATKTTPRSLELDIMRHLLEKAKSAEIGQSESLLQQTNSALSGDFAGLRLLLRHKAVATPSTFSKACLATASSTISWNGKEQIFGSLLVASAGVVKEGDMSKLLADSVTSLPECTQLPQLLLEWGAEVKFETLRVALGTSSLKLLDMLVSNIKSADTIVRTFKHVRKTTMVLDRRYWIYQRLLGKGIPSDDVSEAFLDSLKTDDLGDLSLPKLLLENGASPSYQNGQPFSVALRANSLVAVRLLTQYLVDDNMATVAFDVVRKTPLLKKKVRVEIYRPLLEWNISKPSVSQALVDSFKDGYPDISFLQLLLAKGADPNKDNGHCFAVASKRGSLAEFRALSKYAKLPEVLKVLLNNFREEPEVIRWFKVCLEEQTRFGRLDQDELLFQCMRKFPGGTTLLKLLLDQGVSASAKMDHSLCASWKPEPCTALIWALFSKPRIDNDVILVLLSRGDAGILHIYHIVFPYD
jgi:ankyrin repeat protein